MIRKQTMGMMGCLALMFVLACTVPSFATFTEDTMVLRGTTDTSSSTFNAAGGLNGDTNVTTMLDVAVDSSGQMYFLHFHSEAGDTEILITKYDNAGNFKSVLTVDDNPETDIVMMALAVNKQSGAIYVAAAGLTGALYLYTDTGPHTNSRFTVDTIQFGLINMDSKFGSVDVTVFGKSTVDSVYVVAISDTTFRPTGNRDSGVLLWRFNHTGMITDTKVLIRRNDTEAEDTLALSRGSIPARVLIEAIDTDKIAVVSIGRAPYPARLGGVGYDTGKYGVYYDTFQIGPDGTIVTDSMADTITVLADSVTVNSIAAFDMKWDTFNNRIVIYYALRTSSTKLSRIYIPAFGYFTSSGSNTAVSDNFSFDTLPSAISLSIHKLTGQSVKEHLAYRSRGAGTIHYIKREADATTGNVEIDTVAGTRDRASGSVSLSDSLPVVIAVTNDGAPRIAYEQRVHNQIFINLARQQGASVASGENVSVTTSQTFTSSSGAGTASAPLVSTIVPAFNSTIDSPAQLAQIALTSSPTSPATSSSGLTDFTTPSYVVAVPLGNAHGDTLTVQLKATGNGAGVAVYMRRLTDTNPSGGMGGSSSTPDTSVFAGLSDSQFTACAQTWVKIRLGDTAGNVYDDNAFSDTLAVRLSFTLTPAVLASLMNAGIDTTPGQLAVWVLNSSNAFVQIGNSSAYTQTELNAGGAVTLVSNTITSFSPGGVAKAVGAASGSDGGICLMGRCVESASPAAGAFRSVRDTFLSSKVGRVLTSLYYRMK